VEGSRSSTDGQHSPASPITRTRRRRPDQDEVNFLTFNGIDPSDRERQAIGRSLLLKQQFGAAGVRSLGQRQ
jgi:hypothetical protein